MLFHPVHKYVSMGDSFMHGPWVQSHSRSIGDSTIGVTSIDECKWQGQDFPIFPVNRPLNHVYMIPVVKIFLDGLREDLLDTITILFSPASFVGFPGTCPFFQRWESSNADSQGTSHGLQSPELNSYESFFSPWHKEWHWLWGSQGPQMAHRIVFLPHISVASGSKPSGTLLRMKNKQITLRRLLPGI